MFGRRKKKAAPRIIDQRVADILKEGDEDEEGNMGGSCTGFYVGKKASADGTTLIGQTDDSNFANVSYHSFPAIDLPGRKFIGITGFQYDLPEHTYGYTLFSSHRDDGENSSGIGGINDAGLSYTGSITADPNEKSKAADPFIEKGINEDSIGMFICMCCGSSREAMELLCRTVDEAGSSEGAIFILSDRKETWYVEVYTGHQYAAILLPDDRMSTFGNEFNIIHVAEGIEHKVSPEFESLAVANGFAVYDEGREHKLGNLNVKRTYAEPNTVTCHLRTWRGHALYSDGDVGEYDESVDYPLLYYPKRKISVKDMMDFLRDRCEGTEHCPDTTAGKQRVIGTERTLEAHVLQIHDDLPAKVCTTYWGCIGPAEFGVYLPFNRLVSRFHDAFARTGISVRADGSTMYGAIKKINGICFANRASMKPGVRKYWDDLEDYHLRTFPSVLSTAVGLLSESEEKATEYMTDYCLGTQGSAYADACRILDQCINHLARTANTMLDRIPMPAMMDVFQYSGRFGWSFRRRKGTVTLRRGKERITVTDTSTPQRPMCTVTVNGTVYEKQPCFVWKDMYCIPMETFAAVFSSE